MNFSVNRRRLFFVLLALAGPAYAGPVARRAELAPAWDARAPEAFPTWIGDSFSGLRPDDPALLEFPHLKTLLDRADLAGIDLSDPNNRSYLAPLLPALDTLSRGEAVDLGARQRLPALELAVEHAFSDEAPAAHGDVYRLLAQSKPENLSRLDAGQTQALADSLGQVGSRYGLFLEPGVVEALHRSRLLALREHALKASKAPASSWQIRATREALSALEQGELAGRKDFIGDKLGELTARLEQGDRPNDASRAKMLVSMETPGMAEIKIGKHRLFLRVRPESKRILLLTVRHRNDVDPDELSGISDLGGRIGEGLDLAPLDSQAHPELFARLPLNLEPSAELAPERTAPQDGLADETPNVRTREVREFVRRTRDIDLRPPANDDRKPPALSLVEAPAPMPAEAVLPSPAAPRWRADAELVARVASTVLGIGGSPADARMAESAAVSGDFALAAEIVRRNLGIRSLFRVVGAALLLRELGRTGSGPSVTEQNERERALLSEIGAIHTAPGEERDAVRAARRLINSHVDWLAEQAELGALGPAYVRDRLEALKPRVQEASPALWNGVRDLLAKAHTRIKRP